MRSMPRRAAFAAAAALAVLASPAAADAQRYLGIVVGSEHFGDDTLNDFNPGVTVGWRRPLGARVDHLVEVGVAYNSYREVSPLALTGLDLRIGRIGPGDLSLGASVGTAYYRELSEALEEDYGIPNVAGFIPLAVATVTYRVEGQALRLTFLPTDESVDAVANLSLTFDF